MIDDEGFRANVGIIIVNNEQQVFWAKRVRNGNAWQFPQGGVDKDENIETTLFRELYEEVGLMAQDVSILGVSKNWLQYSLPPKYRRYDSEPLCIGQKQRWFLLQMNALDEKINLQASNKPEFSAWKWVDYWLPVKEVIRFKRSVYQQALQEFAPIIFGK